MANSVITLSTGQRIKFSDQATTVNPSERYNSWADEIGVSKDGTEYILDGDDNCFYFNAINLLGLGDYFGFGSEGGIEIPVKPKKLNILLPVKYSVESLQTIPNVNRYYAADVGTGPRLLVTFHPPYDAGSLGVKLRNTEKFCIIGGAISRSGQVVNFAVRFRKDELDFDLYLNTPSGGNVPVYAQEIAANGSYVSGSQVLLSTLVAGSNIHLVGNVHQGLLGGVVVDAAGKPAARKINVHERATAALVGEGASDAGGSFVIKTKTIEPVYVVALDDDAAPDFNALIYDRVTPQAA